MKVLLSDSNLITSSKIASLIRSAGWEVLSASGWRKAEEVLKENPNVKVAVINLEGFGGVEVLENLKRNFPEVKVVAYCGHKNLTLRSRASDLRAEFVVPNSVIVSQVVQLIGELIS